MSNSYAYSILFREMQYFGVKETSDDWNGAGQNYAISEYGRKIAVVDTASQLLFIASVGSDTALDAVRAAADGGRLTTAMMSSWAAATSGPSQGFYWTIDLKTDPIFKQALALDPLFNTNAPNMGSWISSLNDGAQYILQTPTSANKITKDLVATASFAWDARTFLWTTDSASDQNDNITLTRADAARADRNALVIDGGAGVADFLTVSASMQALMDKARGGISVDLSAGLFNLTLKDGTTVGGTVANVECVRGTDYGDTLVGSAGRDFLDPGLGADIVKGMQGTHGGSLSTKDRVAYWGDVGKGGIKVTCDVALNSDGSAWIPIASVTDVGGDKDTLYNISYVVGSTYDDTYTGQLGRDKSAYAKSANKPATASLANLSYVGEFCGFAGNDTVVGNNYTRISYAYDPASVSVNLDAVDVKNSANLTVAKGTVLDGFGNKDTVSGIFGVRGSAYGDFINMGSASEVVTGEDGDDIIRGNGGNDDLWGSAGSDTITGGSGVDLMFGDIWANDTNNTRERDTFIFKSASEAAGTSTIKGTAGSDTNVRVGDIIVDFTVDLEGYVFDKLDLSAIDASTRVRGDQKFVLSSSNEFSRKAGELILVEGSVTLDTDATKANYHRFAGDMKLLATNGPTTGTKYTQDGTFVMGDLQGDGKADFTIFLVGVRKAALEEIHWGSEADSWLTA